MRLPNDLLERVYFELFDRMRFFKVIDVRPGHPKYRRAEHLCLAYSCPSSRFGKAAHLLVAHAEAHGHEQH